MKRYCEAWLDVFRGVLRARKGRPAAFVILTGLSLLNLMGEWPTTLPRPALVDTLNEVLPDPFGATRQILFDQYQRRFPRVPTAQPVTIVEIDEETLASVGQWPWPRNQLASLIDAIAARKPLAIGLDIYMPEPDQTSPGQVADNLPPSAAALAAGLRALPSHEAILAKSLRAAPTVLGAAAFDHAGFTTSTGLRSVPIQVHGTDPLPSVQRFDYALASLPELQAAAHGQALLSVALELGVVRHIPLVLGLGDKLVPGLPMEMLRLATGSSAIDVFADASGIRAVGVADVEVPTQPDGNIWLHFARMKSSLGRYVSARDVLSGNVDPDRFRDKLIVVGLTGAGLTDMRTTPLGELVPGIEIQAQVIETIFEGRFLRRPGWLKLAEFAVTMLFGLLLIWYVPRTDSRLVHFIRTVPKSFAILGLTLNLLLVSLSFLMFKTLGLLADAASIFIIISALMGSFFTAALLHVSDQTAPRTKPDPAPGIGTGGTGNTDAVGGADKAPGP